jgi:tetratricopeptide (TPR) repeat protein
MADYNQAIALNPNDGANYFARGGAYFDLKRWDNAIADFSRAIAVNPKDVQAYGNRGIAHYMKQDFAASIADLSRTIALDPNFADAYYYRGSSRMSTGDMDGAIKDLSWTIGRNPNHADAYAARGTGRFGKEDYTGAIADYTKCIRLNPQGADYVRFRLALVLRRQGLDDGASGLRPAVLKWPESWPKKVGLFLIGATTESDFLKQAAIAGTQSVTEQQCEAYYYAGMLNLLKGDKARATEFFEMALATKLSPYPEYSLARAELNRLQTKPAIDKRIEQLKRRA